MPTEILYLLEMYKSATPIEKADLAEKILRAIIEWTTEAGPAVIQFESKVIAAANSARMTPQQIQAIRNAFAVLRALKPAVDAAAAQGGVPAISVWQGVMQYVTQLYARFAGGMQNIGRWVMNGGGRSVAVMVAMVRAMGKEILLPLAEGIAECVAAAITAIGGIEVLAVALVAIAILAVMAFAFSQYKSSSTWTIQDPILKRYSSQEAPMPTFRLPLGRLG